MSKVLVIGSNGQLGNEFKQLINLYQNLSFFFVDLPDIDITNEKSILSVFNKSKPDYIVNCAAYTAVDKAESEAELATLVNVTGPELLAKNANAINAKLFHISTDYVFDGTSHKPYIESDAINPISIYGKTKADGELRVVAESAHSVVIRTSWLYSKFGNNFVKTMIRLGAERDRLNVVFDQIGTPTWARDLANYIISMIESKLVLNSDHRIFHYSNEGIASWYDFASEIMRIKELNCSVYPILAKEYPTPAARPHFSVMEKTKIKQTYNMFIPHWKDSLINCLSEF